MSTIPYPLAVIVCTLAGHDFHRVGAPIPGGTMYRDECRRCRCVTNFGSQLTPMPNGIDCPACNGSGLDHYAAADCRHCRGTGVDLARWEYEDQLPETVTDADYTRRFPDSRVIYGIRMFRKEKGDQ